MRMPFPAFGVILVLWHRLLVLCCWCGASGAVRRETVEDKTTEAGVARTFGTHQSMCFVRYAQA